MFSPEVHSRAPLAHANDSRVVHRLLLFLAVAVALLAAAPAAFATSTFPGTFSSDKYPRYLPTDHTTAAMQIQLNTPNTLVDGSYYLKIVFCPTSTYDPATARGYTWNDASGSWVQAQDAWSKFPQLPILNGNVDTSTNNALLWRFAEFGDDSVATSFPTTKWYAFWMLSATGSDSDAVVSDTPVPMTLLNMQTDGGWVHNAKASGISSTQYGARAETGNAGNYQTPWGLSKVEPNEGLSVTPCDDGAQNIIPAAAYNGGFSLYAPYSASSPFKFWVSEQKGNKSWPSPAAATLQIPAPDTNMAVDNTAGADMTPPSVPGTLSAAAAASAVNLSWGAATDTGGVTAYRVYRWTDATPIGGLTNYTPLHAQIATVTGATTYSDTSAVAGVTYHYEVRAVDAASNVGPRSNTASGSLLGDTTPPVTTAATLPPLPGSGWFTTPVLVSLSATDDSSGVASVSYTIDGGPAVITPGATASVTLSTEGAHTVAYWALDKAGNTETSHNLSVDLDTKAPTTSDNADGVWHAGDVNVLITPTDASSGVASTTYTLDGSAHTLQGSQPFTVKVTGDGNHTLTYASTDVAGNVQGTVSRSVKIDAVQPITTATVPAPPAGGVYTGSVKISLSATDPAGAGGFASGVATISYQIDNGTAVNVSSSSTDVTISQTGTHTLTFWATDVAGNVEDNTKPANSVTVKISNPLPVTTDDAPSSWVNHAVTVHLSPTDVGGPGIDYTTYSVDGGAWAKGTSVFIDAPSDSTSDGVHTIQYYSVDKDGLAESVHSCTVNVDTSAPVTTANNVPTDWQNSPVTVKFTVDDLGGSGVAATQYSLDSGTTWKTGTSVTIGASPTGADDGQHAVLYRSLDNAGNAETPQGFTVGIDTQAPDVTGLVPADGASYAIGSGTQATWAATDATSGVVDETATLDGSPIAKGDAIDTAGAGLHTFTLTVTDAAGNQTVISRVFSDVVKDTVAPDTTDDAPAPTDWENTPVTVNFDATDNAGGSGVADTKYSLDNGNSWQSGTSVTILAPAGGGNDGAHTILYYSIDRAGNAETPDTCVVNIDTQAPAVTGVVPVDGQSYGIGSNTLASWHSADATSGIDSEEATIDGQAIDPATTMIDSLGEGVHTFVLTVTDLAGNETVVTRQFSDVPQVVDTTAPTTTDDAPDGWQNGDVTVNLTANDDPGGSGVASTSYKVDNGSWKTGTSVDILAPSNGGNDGVHTIWYYSVDKTGNTEQPAKSCTVSIDTQGPAATGVVPADGATYVIGTGATAAWSCSDGRSGLDTASATLDGQPVNAGDPIDAGAAGHHTFVLTATDKAGNQTVLTNVFNTVAENIGIAVPAGGESWQSGTSRTVRWSVSYPVSRGQFGIWMVDSGGTWHSLRTLNAVAGQRIYTVAVPVAVPAGPGYKIIVAWRQDASATSWVGTATSAAFNVTPPQSITVTNPAGGGATIWQKGSTQPVVWTLVNPVSGGQFGLWLVDANQHATFLTYVKAVAGAWRASTRVKVVVPAGNGYRVVVRWRKTVGSGEWQLSGSSPQFSVAPAQSLRMTDPVKHETWKRGTNQNVGWTVVYPVTGGQFGVWLVSHTGHWYQLTTVNVTSGSRYSVKVRANVPAGGGYRVVVRWRGDTSSSVWQLSVTSTTITVKK